MKILIVSNLFPPSAIGGYELNCSNMTRELRARGHDVLVATSPSQVPGDPDPPYIRRCLVMAAHMPGYHRAPRRPAHHRYFEFFRTWPPCANC